MVADPAVLWTRYIQLTQIEAAFRSLKSDLGLRPIYHRLDRRVEAHIFVAFLAYCLQVTLKNRLQIHAPGLSPTAVLEKLAEIQMIDVWIPTKDQRWLILPRYTQPSNEPQILLDKLRLALPAQPPPRIKSPTPLPVNPQAAPVPVQLEMEKAFPPIKIMERTHEEAMEALYARAGCMKMPRRYDRAYYAR
jgi:hypothetical protein